MNDESMAQRGNKFNIYIGMSLEDLPRTTTKLRVHLQEISPYSEGKVQPVLDEKIISDGQGGESNVTMTNSIEAEFFYFQTNRRYAPDIKKSEPVLVINYADSDDYYWIPLGRADFLRRTERLNFNVSNVSEATDVLNDENTYFVELDTVEKFIKICTSKSDGETYLYGIKMDTKNGTLHICDDDDNEISIDSNIPRILVKNKEGSCVDVSDKNVTIAATQDIILRAGRQIVIDAPMLTGKETDGTALCVFNCNNMSIKANGSMTIQAPSIGLGGAVIANTIVAGPIQATGYSTGGAVVAQAMSLPIQKARSVVNTIKQYIPAVSNIITGTGTSPINTPNTGDGSNNNRHCTAWEQISEAIEELATAIDNIDGSQKNHTDKARELVQASIMPYNRGE